MSRQMNAARSEYEVAEARCVRGGRGVIDSSSNNSADGDKKYKYEETSGDIRLE